MRLPNVNLKNYYALNKQDKLAFLVNRANLNKNGLKYVIVNVSNETWIDIYKHKKLIKESVVNNTMTKNIIYMAGVVNSIEATTNSKIHIY